MSCDPDLLTYWSSGVWLIHRTYLVYEPLTIQKMKGPTHLIRDNNCCSYVISTICMYQWCHPVVIDRINADILHIWVLFFIKMNLVFLTNCMWFHIGTIMVASRYMPCTTRTDSILTIQGISWRLYPKRLVFAIIAWEWGTLLQLFCL